MQTKKKVAGKCSSRNVANPRFSRHQKKASENVEIQEKKVTEPIPSSARKQRAAGNIAKKDSDQVAGTNLITRYGLVDDETTTMCLVRDAHHAIDSTSINCGSNDATSNQKSETIFSPPFHISKSVGGGIENNADFVKVFRVGDQQSEDCGKENLPVGILNQGSSGFPPDVSAIYLSMKNSKLECVDECNQDPNSTDVRMEEDEYEEFDDFDPYFFIKNLPDLMSVVPTFRPVLLPKQTRSCPMTTLVLDLDETLVHSSLEPCEDADFTFSVNFELMEHTVFVRCRPYLKDFMEKVSGLFEIIIFTASQSIYAEQLLNMLDPKRKIFRHRVYRESCVFIDGNYLKDLSVLGRDLAHVIIIDNSPQAFGFQVDNGIPIESWFDDRTDKELLLLLPFLESLVGVDDVRPLIAKKFNLREKIAAAVCPLSSTGADPFER